MNNFFKKLDELDNIVSRIPSDINIQLFKTLTSSSEVIFRYGMDKLTRKDWFYALREEGYFSKLPALFSNNIGNQNWNEWPQAEYLKRIALQGDLTIQKDVLEIMIETGMTTNYSIHRHFTEAALSMPVNLAVLWARHETKWLQDGNAMGGVLEGVLGQLVSKLAKEGQKDDAIALAAEVLAVLPDSEHSNNSIPEPRFRCEEYYYEKILEKCIPDLASVAPFQTLETLCKLLDDYLRYSSREGEGQKPKDYSYIRRPAIEDHDQNHDFSIDCRIINAIRNVAEHICRTNPAETEKAVNTIEAHGWYVFKRIGLYLLRVIPEAPMPMIRDRLVDQDLFDNAQVHHEYYGLLKDHFNRLEPYDKEAILSWIDLADRLREYLETSDSGKTTEQRERDIRWWQYQRLIPIQEYLAGEWKERFMRLKEELGEPAIPPDFVSWSEGGLIEPESPLQIDDLSHMSVDELVEYLRQWRPTGEWRAPTPEGLGRTIETLVEGQPEKFTDSIELLMVDSIDPTYIRHIVSGFGKVLESKQTIDYAPVIRLCAWIMAQPRDIPGRSIPSTLRGNLEIDQDWGLTRQAIAPLLEKMFNDEVQFPYELRASVWEVIKALIEDPEPDLAYEDKYGDDGEDFSFLTLNTVRGYALHVLMTYALWVLKKVRDEVELKEKRAPDFRDMPEVRQAIEERIDISKSEFAANQTDRAVLGRWLPQLIHIDAKWVNENLEALFPTDPKLANLRRSAWNAYLLYARLYVQVFDVIKDIYVQEIKIFSDKDIRWGSRHSPESKIIEHVLIMYAWEKLSLDDNDLVDLLFHSIPSEACAYAIDFIGRSMKQGMEPQMVGRFKALWEWRIQTMGGIEHIQDNELSAFAWWFASNKCGDDWAFPYIEKVLERIAIERAKMSVFEHMSAIFRDFPGQSLRCLRFQVEKNTDPFFFYPREDEGIWNVLKQGMAHADPNIRDAAEAIIHLLGSKNYLGYRELLKMRDNVEQA